MPSTNDFLSKPLISLQEGKNCGIVTNMLFDADLKKVTDVLIFDQIESVYLLLPANKIKFMENDAVVTETAFALSPYDANVFNPINFDVFDTRGKHIGIVTEILLNKNYTVQSIECNGLHLTPGQIYSHSEGTLIIKTATVKKTRAKKAEKKVEVLPSAKSEAENINADTNATPNSVQAVAPTEYADQTNQENNFIENKAEDIAANYEQNFVLPYDTAITNKEPDIQQNFQTQENNINIIDDNEIVLQNNYSDENSVQNNLETNYAERQLSTQTKETESLQNILDTQQYEDTSNTVSADFNEYLSNDNGQQDSAANNQIDTSDLAIEVEQVYMGSETQNAENIYLENQNTEAQNITEYNLTDDFVQQNQIEIQSDVIQSNNVTQLQTATDIQSEEKQTATGTAQTDDTTQSTDADYAAATYVNEITPNLKSVSETNVQNENPTQSISHDNAVQIAQNNAADRQTQQPLGTNRTMTGTGSFMLGRRCDKNIMNRFNEIIVKQGTIISHETIKKAKINGKLLELSMHAK